MSEARKHSEAEQRGQPLPAEAPKPAGSPRPPDLRVLLIGPSLRILGGQAVMANQLLQRMRRDGLAIDFLPINPKPAGPLALAEGVKGLRTTVVSAFYIGSLLARVRHYDVIHLFSASYLSFLIAQMPAILVARLYRKPVILNYRSGEAEDHLANASPLPFALLRMCRQIAVPSPFLVGVFGRFGFDAVAIPNVIDPEQFRHRLRKSCAPRILVPRTLEPLYNVECALRALARIQQECPEAAMTVLGDGSQEQALRSLAAELGLRNLHFAGRVERGEMGRIFDEHDLLLNTSSIDNMPVSLLEGFAAGLPIVTTDAGGIPAFVRDRENAYMVPVDDDAAVAERVLELVRRPDEVRRLSAGGAVETQKYVWPAVARDWYALYARAATADGAAKRSDAAEPPARAAQPIGRGPSRAARVRQLARRFAQASPDEWRLRASQKGFEWRARLDTWRGRARPHIAAQAALESLGVSDGAALARWWPQRAPRWFLGDERRGHLAAGSEPSPDEFARLLECADAVVAGQFPLFSLGRVPLGPDAGAWCVEPVSGRRAPRRFYADIATLDSSVVGDHKFLWEPSRFAFGLWLGVAHRRSGEERYWERFRELASSWFDENPYPLGAHYHSALELGFRAYAWVWALALFRERLAKDSDLLSALLGGIWTSCRHIEQNLSRYYSPNTHLTGEAFALFACGAALPEFAEAARWRKIGAEVLREEAAQQFYDDGTHREGSSGYHLYSTDFYLHASLIARETGFQLDPAVERCALRASRRLAEFTGAGGILPPWNDCDGGRLLSLGEAALDARPTLALALVAFPHDDALRAAVERASLDACALEEDLPGCAALLAPHSQAANARPQAAPARAPAEADQRARLDSGIAIHQSPTRDHLVFRASPFGYLASPHSHDAALSLIFTLRGHPILVDSGTGSYTGDADLRQAFRGALGKNVLCFDGRGPSQPGGPFDWLSTTDAALLEVAEAPDEFRCRGAYEVPSARFGGRDGGTLHVSRQVQWQATQGKLALSDQWRGNPDCPIELRFTLAPGIAVDLAAHCLRVPGLGDLAFTLESGPGQAPPEPAVERVPHSPDYGSIGETQALVIRLGSPSQGQCRTLFALSSASTTSPAPGEVL